METRNVLLAVIFSTIVFSCLATIFFEPPANIKQKSENQITNKLKIPHPIY